MTGPCSAGTLKISPRASKAARLPVGDTLTDVMRSATFTLRGFNVERSVTTCTETSDTASFARFSKCRRSPATKTMSVGPSDGVVTS